MYSTDSPQGLFIGATPPQARFFWGKSQIRLQKETSAIILVMFRESTGGLTVFTFQARAYLSGNSDKPSLCHAALKAARQLLKLCCGVKVEQHSVVFFQEYSIDAESTFRQIPPHQGLDCI